MHRPLRSSPHRSAAPSCARALRCGALFSFACLSLGAPAAEAAPLSPAVKAERIAPPKVLIPGVKTLRIGAFGGHEPEQLQADLAKALVDPARETHIETAAELLGDIAKLGGELAAEAAGAAAGSAVSGAAGGAAGKATDAVVTDAVGAAVDGVGEAVAGLVADPVRTAAGLVTTVFAVTNGEADATISGSSELTDAVEEFKAMRVVTDERGLPVFDGPVPQLEEVDCRRRTVTLTISWSIASQGAGVLGAGEVPIKEVDTKCGEQQPKLASKEDLAKKAMAIAGVALANDFAPHWVTARLEMRRDKSLRGVMDLHRADDPKAALCASHIAALFAPETHEAVLAAGAFTEGLGYVADAKVLYEKAAAMNTKDKLAQQRVAGAGARLDEVAAMESTYGLRYATAEPLESLCPPLPTGRPAVVKRGAPVWESEGPEGGAEVGKAEKGTKVIVTAEGGVRVAVTTADGVKGWIAVKDLK
jgi:hypothetical protein